MTSIATHRGQPIISPDKDRFLNEENPFEAMMSRFDYAAPAARASTRASTRCCGTPRSRSSSSVPVQLDNGEVEVYTGYRVLYNTSRGPGQGRHPVRHEGARSTR